MKKFFLLTVFTLIISSGAYAQKAWGFGFKGGLNYSANGDYFDAIGDNVEHPDRNIGYHLGIIGKVGDRIYFKPELVYTKTKSDYDNDSFTMQKLDAPMLLGVRVIGPLSVFAGPSFQYVLDTDFDDIAISDVKNDFSVGLNFGIGVNFKLIGIDLRYERGFSDNEVNIINDVGINTGGRLDTRPDQLILSLSFIL
ncbi:MAG: outer membrane beta-barrel protein [Flavobacteriaceae bacterium]|nr:PorT family protein [Mangrovimonas sp.]MCB0436109.1 PorT family protein [Mangrovimonas sp.]MCB0471399.1 PorT family protein [Flavobacteriaceae bacterium]HPF96592.1 outer membrane beta-barrel protein [Mangrovimonas sp.]